MKLLNFLLGLLAVLPSTFASEGDDEQAVALDIVSAYVFYDMDVDIWGVYNGYIASKCTGSGKNKRCTFDEFVNFVVFGTAASKPSYYDLPSGYSLSSGDVLMLTNFIREKLKEAHKEVKAKYDRISEGRKTSVGIWSDLGYALNKDKVVGADKHIDLDQRLRNIHMMMGAVSLHRSKIFRAGTLDKMKESVKDVKWQISERQSQGQKWREINWEETVRKNPDMANPKSDLFRAVTEELNTIYKDKDFSRELTISNKVNAQMRGCL